MDNGNKYLTLAGLNMSITKWTAVFAILSVVGQVGQNVSLPIFAGTLVSDGASPYFLLTWASFSYVVIFFIWLWLLQAFTNQIGEREKMASHKKLFIIGACDALNGLMAVFASPPSRTPAYLQALLGTFMIPMTIVFRWMVLDKRINLVQGVAGGGVLAGLFIALIPKIFGMVDEDNEQTVEGAWKVVWPMIFMCGFAPLAMMNVLEEREVKSGTEYEHADIEAGKKPSNDARGINMIYFFAYTSLYQLITCICLFWVDLIPEVGSSADMQEFSEHLLHGLQSFFGTSGYNGEAGGKGMIFIFMYTTTYLSGGLLLRHAEGALYYVIVQASVAPLGGLFWTLFKDETNPYWSPSFDNTTAFSLGGLVIMVPAIVLFQMSELGLLRQMIGMKSKTSKSLKDPLLAKY